MSELIKKLLNESLKQYLGQCDRLRMINSDNEEYWHQMMANKRKIPFKTFINSVDMSAILEDDETPEQYLKDSLRSDPETATYVSNWGGKPAMFLQTAGFEFIFV